MPFGGWFDIYYRDIYRKAISNADLNPVRGDDILRPSVIVRDIWEDIKDSKALLADLTNRNPNVYYELGLAHALSKPVVLVANNIEDIPFDLRHLRIITYDTRMPNWHNSLKREITTALKEAIEADDNLLKPF